ncbi:MAG: MFS transporter [Mycobacteriales bacterium]
MTTTVIPAAASRRATAAPMPDEEPVTSATPSTRSIRSTLTAAPDPLPGVVAERGRPLGSPPAPGSTRAVPLRAAPLVLAQFCCFLGVGAILPVLPVHLVKDLHASGLVLGVVLGVFPFAALVGRFLGGWAADRRGRARTLVGGLLGCSVAGFLLMLPLPAAGLAGVRLLHGVSQALVAVAAVTWLLDVTDPSRRAQSLGVIGTGVWGGTTLGTLVGGLSGSLAAAGALAGVAALAGLPALRWAQRPPALVRTARPGKLLPSAAIIPGVTFGLGTVGYAAVVGFVVLHLDEHRASGTLALTVFSAAVLLGRLAVVPVAARFGLLRSLRLALVVVAAGLALLAAARGPVLGVVGALLVAVGHCVIWPALGALVLGRVPAQDRGSAVGAMTAFYDISVGLSSLAFGLVATRSGTTLVFLLAAAVVLLAAGFDAVFARHARAGELDLQLRTAEPEPAQ